MKALGCGEIAKMSGGVLTHGDNNTLIGNICTDSRKATGGDLFVAIAGEKFDGHDFVEAAFRAGASAVLTHRDITPPEGKVVIKVADTLRALGRIAGYYRQKFKIPFIAVTGSVGKTSTKDMIFSILSQKFKVLKTEGNFNNEIGLPLTIFKLDDTHEAAVVEMGMSGFGEISRLTAIARPDAAVITNIGLSHIEKLGSRQNILKAKMEILEGLSNNGLVILNGDDNLLYALKGLLKHRIVYYGMEEWADYRAHNIRNMGENGLSFTLLAEKCEFEVYVPVPGIHNIYNALAAIATGIEFGLAPEKIIKGLAEYVPGEMRLSISNISGIKLINDAYNASPQSMEAAIDVLKDAGKGMRKVAILGDMLEMGSWAPDAHYGVGRYAAYRGVNRLIAVGRYAQSMAGAAIDGGMDPVSVSTYDTIEAVIEHLDSLIRPGDAVLIKGSRGMKMEKAADYLNRPE